MQTKSTSVADRLQHILHQSQQQRHLTQSTTAQQRVITTTTTTEANPIFSQYMFTENKQKDVVMDEEPSPSNSITNQKLPQYISTINTRKNPDILVPGAKFLKGNKYFSKKPPVAPSSVVEEEGEAV